MISLFINIVIINTIEFNQLRGNLLKAYGAHVSKTFLVNFRVKIKTPSTFPRTTYVNLTSAVLTHTLICMYITGVLININKLSVS